MVVADLVGDTIVTDVEGLGSALPFDNERHGFAAIEGQK